jgi:hypothetical protein
MSIPKIGEKIIQIIKKNIMKKIEKSCGKLKKKEEKIF